MVVTLLNGKALLNVVCACVYTQAAGDHSPGLHICSYAQPSLLSQDQAQFSRGMSLKSGKCAFCPTLSFVHLPTPDYLSLSLSHLYSNHVISFLNTKIQQLEHQLVTVCPSPQHFSVYDSRVLYRVL